MRFGCLLPARILVIRGLAGLLSSYFGLACILPAYALDEDLQLWAPVTLELPVGERLHINMEVQPRLQDNLSDLQLLLFRPSVSLDLNRHVAVTAGYLFATRDPARHQGNHIISENRAWQQLLLSHAVGKTALNHQFRLEQRFLDEVNNVGWRGLYLIRAVRPLGNSKWSAVVSNETILNANDAGPNRAGLAQNRTFMGLRHPVGKHLTLEGGYMLQWLNQTRINPNQLNHILLIRANVILPELKTGKKPEPPPIYQDTPALPY